MVEKKDERFEPGDLVTYYEFATYYYGEGAVKYKGQGIVVEPVIMEWNSETRAWIEHARWQPYDTVRYRILCLKTGRSLILGGKALILISRVNNNQ